MTKVTNGNDDSSGLKDGQDEINCASFEEEYYEHFLQVDSGAKADANRKHRNSVSLSSLAEDVAAEEFASTQSLLEEVCEKLDLDFAEMWLRIDPTKHKLIHYHVSDELDELVRKQVIDVYRGKDAAKMKHRLSSAMCKWTREKNEILKLTNQSSSGALALQKCLVNVCMAVAVPVSHDGIDVTLVYCSTTRENMESWTESYLIQKSLEIVKNCSVNL
jgi:hypothetical protein